jgi:hypothetical protein
MVGLFEIIIVTLILLLGFIHLFSKVEPKSILNEELETRMADVLNNFFSIEDVEQRKQFYKDNLVILEEVYKECDFYDEELILFTSATMLSSFGKLKFEGAKSFLKKRFFSAKYN